MEIYNRTGFEPQTIIEHFQLLKIVKSNWRQRDIELYQHPEDENKVISIGIDFDKKQMVVVEETKQEWNLELNSPNSVVVTY